MHWQGGRRSKNVDDRRGQRAAYGAGAGGSSLALRFLPMLVRTKVGRVVLIAGIALVVGGRMLGFDVLSLLDGGDLSVSQPSAPLSEADQQMAEFVSVVLADTEETWHGIFNELGRTYREPTLVLFTSRVNSACGSASAAVGPFYCPGDQQVYIDLSFFQDLDERHDAPGDFAQAYVIAHEVGHHVQTLLGISSQVADQRRGASETLANELSVKQELQADCFAGLWGYAANNVRQLLDPGDLEEALQAATAIGDDRLQREAGRQVVPDSFTHGTSAQRVRWFRKGFETGNFEACNTFTANSL